jgi:hypothetical protein
MAHEHEKLKDINKSTLLKLKERDKVIENFREKLIKKNFE